MTAITTSELIYLLPILILGLAIIVLLFLLLLLRINTKFAALFTVVSLAIALSTSTFVGYQIIVNTDKQHDTIIAPLSVQTQSADVLSTELELYPPDPTPVAPSLAIKQANLVQAEEHLAVYWQASYVTALFTSDGYGALYTSLVLILSIIVSTLALNWFKNDEETHHGLFYLMILFSALGATILIYASHLMSLFIGIELLSIPIVGLIGYQYQRKYALEAAIKYMVLSVISTTFLLLGIAFYYAATGELTFIGLSFQLSTLSAPSTLLLLGVCLMLVGIGFKLALFPFQLWLPDVYQGAPTCIALWLTTVSKVAVFCAVARLFLLAPIVNNETIRMIMVIMAFCSIIWGSVFALKQQNIKRLLAYSSITHFGYLLIALISVQYQVLALETIGVYLIGYVLANICVLSVISLESRSTEKEEQALDLSGLFWRKPIIALAMGTGLLSLAGVPLTVGFIGQFSLILLGVTAELWWLIGAIIIGSALGLYFYLRLVISLYMKPTHIKVKPSITLFTPKRIDINEFFIVVSALLILLCGIYPKWLFNLVSVAQYLSPN
ncbi:NADH dehydrogenase subunit N [Orbus hercynius]|uniref:NADH-quinone oxidoreductase subunit N n=1 Tax=Orbus hercynius TaxID=593135 RepID=A0A495REK5_9GAMM|nr:NADH-quinone oxidoreductase subunit N [Orbus hercynius]RKS85740.1 NADH dehydrogenase subunit N [Orbus hercynius]